MHLENPLLSAKSQKVTQNVGLGFLPSLYARATLGVQLDFSAINADSQRHGMLRLRYFFSYFY